MKIATAARGHDDAAAADRDQQIGAGRNGGVLGRTHRGIGRIVLDRVKDAGIEIAQRRGDAANVSVFRVMEGEQITKARLAPARATASLRLCSRTWRPQ